MGSEEMLANMFGAQCNDFICLCSLLSVFCFVVTEKYATGAKGQLQLLKFSNCAWLQVPIILTLGAEKVD